MCRFLVFISRHPALLGDVVIWPEHSIMKQSYASTERFEESTLPTQLNADGFGVGWFARHHLLDDDTPCVFTSTLPAWNNQNLWRLSEKISSPLIFAHVRAATPGSAVTDTNCHPFAYGHWLFMHNGGVSDFGSIKKRLVAYLDDEVYVKAVRGTTDSEHAFALWLTEMKRLGAIDRTPGSAATAAAAPAAGSTTDAVQLQAVHELMAEAMRSTLSLLQRFRREAGITAPATSSMNFAVSDGESVVVTRFIAHDTRAPASMYFSAGTEFRRMNEEGQYRMSHRDRREDVVIVASERLTTAAEDWVEVPKNTMVVITPQLNVLQHPLEVDKPEP